MNPKSEILLYQTEDGKSNVQILHKRHPQLDWGSQYKKNYEISKNQQPITNKWQTYQL
jgi:hypothetical protein